MPVTREECTAALSRLRLDRIGTLLGSEVDLSICAGFARQMVPVLAQAHAVFWEGGGSTGTPARAALALALHAADPGLFHFPSCHCHQRKQRGSCEGDAQCARLVWVQSVQRQARAPKMPDGSAP